MLEQVRVDAIENAINIVTIAITYVITNAMWVILTSTYYSSIKELWRIRKKNEKSKNKSKFRSNCLFDKDPQKRVLIIQFVKSIKHKVHWMTYLVKQGTVAFYKTRYCNLKKQRYVKHGTSSIKMNGFN